FHLSEDHYYFSILSHPFSRGQEPPLRAAKSARRFYGGGKVDWKIACSRLIGEILNLGCALPGKSRKRGKRCVYGRISAAAFCTARTILSYPVHRQRLPASHQRISSSVGFGFLSSSAFAATRKPGVQNPH